MSLCFVQRCNNIRISPFFKLIVQFNFLSTQEVISMLSNLYFIVFIITLLYAKMIFLIVYEKENDCLDKLYSFFSCLMLYAAPNSIALIALLLVPIFTPVATKLL